MLSKIVSAVAVISMLSVACSRSPQADDKKTNPPPAKPVVVTITNGKCSGESKVGSLVGNSFTRQLEVNGKKEDHLLSIKSDEEAEYMITCENGLAATIAVPIKVDEGKLEFLKGSMSIKRGQDDDQQTCTVNLEASKYNFKLSGECLELDPDSEESSENIVLLHKERLEQRRSTRIEISAPGLEVSALDPWGREIEFVNNGDGNNNVTAGNIFELKNAMIGPYKFEYKNSSDDAVSVSVKHSQKDKTPGEVLFVVQPQSTFKHEFSVDKKGDLIISEPTGN